MLRAFFQGAGVIEMLIGVSILDKGDLVGLVYLGIGLLYYVLGGRE